MSLLPASGVESAFRRAAEDRDHGAAEIELTLLEELSVVAGTLDRQALEAGSRLLRLGQPAMANLWGLATVAASAGPREFGVWAAARHERLARLGRDLAAAAWPAIRTRRRLVTVSRSSSVLACVVGAVERGWEGDVVVLEGGPDGHGRVQASVLRDRGVDARSQPDAAAAGWLDDAAVGVVVGADAIGRRRFLNATGTRPLLELARRRLLPVLLVGDAGKRVEEAWIDELLRRVTPPGEGDPDRSWAPFEAVPLALVGIRLEAG